MGRTRWDALAGTFAEGVLGLIDFDNASPVGNVDIRSLSAKDLGYTFPQDAVQPAAAPDDSSLAALPEDDPILRTARHLLRSFGGLIFTGPPGTSKSYYAARLAVTLAGDINRVRFIQFHPSYQYEDFVMGYVPREDGSGFDLRPKHLIQLCDAARGSQDTYVLVIDELSRGDCGRIFGEALTYVERSKRGRRFQVASGQLLDIPTNVVFLATMNPLDRGVDEVDAAFERRFAKISMEPDESLLSVSLSEKGMDDSLRKRLLAWFRDIQKRAITNPAAAIGHTYFMDATDVDDLHDVWNHQLKFHFERAFRLDRESLNEVQSTWSEVVSHAATDG